MILSRYCCIIFRHLRVENRKTDFGLLHYVPLKILTAALNVGQVKTLPMCDMVIQLNHPYSVCTQQCSRHCKVFSYAKV